MCFNPCFSGFISATVEMGSATTNYSFCFNPCFSGFISATFQKNNAAIELFKFQSLFQWIYLCNDLNRQSSYPKYYSFNPCFSGFISATAHVNIIKLPYISFNPCFSGFISATPLNYGEGCFSFQFQSLFQWIYLCNTISIEYGRDKTGVFQSLFQWIYLCNSRDFPFFTPFSPIFLLLFSHTFSRILFI